MASLNASWTNFSMQPVKSASTNMFLQAKAQVVPRSSLVEIEVEVEVGVWVKVGIKVEVQLKCSYIKLG